MKFEMSTPLLQAVSNKLVKAVSTKDIIPSLKNFLFEVEGKTIHIVAGDSATYLEKTIPCATISEEGKVLIDGKDFTRLINKINTDTVVLSTTTDNKLKIQAGKSNFHLKTIDPDAYVYPENLVPDVSGKVITLAEMKKAMKLGSITVSKNATEVYFTGYRVGSAIMTTNRNNLTIYNYNVCEEDMLLTQDMVNLIHDLDGETAEISFTQDFMEVKTDGTRILGNLLSGIEFFPPMDILGQFTHDKSATISKKELLPVLDRAMVFVQDLGVIELSFEKNVIKCTLVGNLDSQSYEEINYVGDLGIKINVNVGMLKEICGALETDLIDLKIDAPESPLLIKSGSYECLMATMIVE